MSVSNHLYELIKSLSKNEKRYFKLFCSLQKGEKNYLKLFDFLDSLSTNDEEKIINRFAEEDFVRNVHVTKNYLYNLILKSLRSYQAEKTINIRLANLWIDVDLLKRRGLYQQSWDRLQKTKKIAMKFQDHLTVLKVCEKELSYIAERATKKLTKQQDEISQNIQKYLDLIQAEFLTLIDYYQFSTLYRQHNKNTQLLKEKIEARGIIPMEDDALKDQSFAVKYLTYYIKALFSRIEGDHVASHKYLAKVIAVWREYFFMIDEKSKIYKIHLSNYLTSCHIIKKYDDFREEIKEFENISIKSFDEEAEVFQNVVHHELRYRLNTLNFKDIEEVVTKIEKGLITYQHKINKAREIVLYFNLSILFFLKKEFQIALDWLNKILQDGQCDHRKDLQRSAHIFQLIFHLELNNYELLENLRLSSYRKLKRWAPLSCFEKSIFEAIKAWGQAIHTKEKDEVLKNLQSTLQEIKDQDVSQVSIGLEEVMVWLSDRNN